MQGMLQVFSTITSPAQSIKLFTTLKAAHKSCTDHHYLYLTAVSDACVGADNLALQSIVNYADPNMRMTMLARSNIQRPDSLGQTKELTQFAQHMKIESQAKNLGRDVVDAFEPKGASKERVVARSRKLIDEGGDQRTCYRYE
uniref:Uncharacterized protein n=1 Tax=Peronospora matthiolae TaxID=2874970 RepID=A0AAV1TKS8_9STRA